MKQTYKTKKDHHVMHEDQYHLGYFFQILEAHGVQNVTFDMSYLQKCTQYCKSDSIFRKKRLIKLLCGVKFFPACNLLVTSHNFNHNNTLMFTFCAKPNNCYMLSILLVFLLVP